LPAAGPTSGGPPVLLRGTDRAAFAVAFADRLRTAGVPAGLTHVADLVHALDVSPPVSVTKLYWTARIALVRRQADVAAFNRVFDAVFADAPPLPVPHSSGQPAQRDNDVNVPMPTSTDQVTGGSGLPWATLPTVVEASDDPAGTGPAVPELRPSALAALATRPFEDLDATQTAALGEALRKSLTTWPIRRTRRHATDPSGRRIALRPTIARARRTGWEPVTIVRERPIRRPRRVVLLCDVSESMRAQATAYLHLMRAFTLVADAEVFAFATTLTRLTPALRQTSPSEAIARATETVTDRFGGTRIATNIDSLLASHHGNAIRGGLVIVASDGWDSDPPDRLALAMARLRRRAYRIFWLNPRAGQPGFAPRVASMAAALPFCDRLMPAATFADLQACAQLWATTSARGARRHSPAV
jgi:uncharacterized protein with von Willebrand factor type A (vWA) domain